MKNHVTFTLVVLSLFGFMTSCASTGTKVAKPNTSKNLISGNSYFQYMMSEVLNQPQSVASSQAYLEAALKKAPSSPYLKSQLAIKEAQQNNFAKALSTAQEALEADPNNTDNLLLVGKLLAAQNRYLEAISHYKKLLRLDPKNEEAYNVMAREYVALKDEANAVSSLKACVRALSEASSCRFYLATLYLQAQDYKNAIKAYEDLLVYNPDNQKILATLAEVYVQERQFEKALSVYERLVSLFPGDATYEIRMALIYYQKEDFDKAITTFESIEKTYPRSDRIQYFLGLLKLQQGQTEEAYGHFDHIDPESDFFKESLNHMINILRDQGKLPAAITLLDEKLPKSQKNESYYALKVSLLALNESYDEALRVLDQGLRRFENQAGLLFQKALLQEKQEDWPGAKMTLEQVLAIAPQSVKALNFLGYTMLEKGEDFEEAFHLIEKAYSLDPDDGHVTDSMGWAYFKQGDFKKALELLQKANGQQPDEPAILEHLGEVYFQLKNKKQARQNFEKALRILSKKEKLTPEDEKIKERITKRLGDF